MRTARFLGTIPVALAVLAMANLLSLSRIYIMSGVSLIVPDELG